MGEKGKGRGKRVHSPDDFEDERPNGRARLDSYEVEKREPQFSFSDLAGLDELEESLRENIIYPFVNPRVANIVRQRLPRGILLTGQPGTGKTAIADSIVTEIRAQGVKINYYVETGCYLSSYVGESEAKVRNLFELAHKNAPSVIFLDELDGIGQKRDAIRNHCAQPTIMATLLTELNKIEAGKVLIVAATNCPLSVDPALIRPGRFDLRYDISLPNKHAREKILVLHCQKKGLSVSKRLMELIVEKTDNFSGSHLENIVECIHVNALRRVFPNWSHYNGQLTPKQIEARLPGAQRIDTEDVRLAFKKLLPGANDEDKEMDSDSDNPSGEDEEDEDEGDDDELDDNDDEEDEDQEDDEEDDSEDEEEDEDQEDDEEDDCEADEGDEDQGDDDELDEDDDSEDDDEKD